MTELSILARGSAATPARFELRHNAQLAGDRDRYVDIGALDELRGAVDFNRSSEESIWLAPELAPNFARYHDRHHFVALRRAQAEFQKRRAAVSHDSAVK